MLLILCESVPRHIPAGDGSRVCGIGLLLPRPYAAKMLDAPHDTGTRQLNDHRVESGLIRRYVRREAPLQSAPPHTLQLCLGERSGRFARCAAAGAHFDEGDVVAL